MYRVTQFTDGKGFHHYLWGVNSKEGTRFLWYSDRYSIPEDLSAWVKGTYEEASLPFTDEPQEELGKFDTIKEGIDYIRTLKLLDN